MIEPDDVRAFINKRLRQVSPTTVRKEFLFLRKLFKEAAKPVWRHISNLDEDFRNPCADITPPRANPPRTRILKENELKKLLDQCPNEVIRSIVLFAVNSGCRQGEILPLREEQVNWENEFIYWPKTKNRLPKNLPLSPALKRILKEVPRPEGSPYFFCSPRLKKPYTRDGFKRVFKRMVERAGIENFHFHDLRRVFGTKLAELGYGEKDIAELLGHASTESTRIYIEITDERKREAMEKVDFGELGKSK